MDKKQNMNIAFIVGSFPEVSETFIIDQACDLIDRGVEIDIYAFNRGRAKPEHISSRYFKYGLENRTRYLNVPAGKAMRILLAGPRLIGLTFRRPLIIFKIIANAWRAKSAVYFKIFLWNVKPLFDKKYDLYHCHFGSVGTDFVAIKKLLGIRENFLTSLYGNDISKRIKEKGVRIYDELKEESVVFIVMSENMKQRVIGHGFPAEKIIVHPISIEMNKYEFKERKAFAESGKVNMISVGRFVEKKGFDDLIRAMAIVKEKSDKKFSCHIVGDGPLKKELHSLADSLKLNNVVDFKGVMAIDKVLKYFDQMDFYLQPSKTAKDGDME